MPLRPRPKLTSLQSPLLSRVNAAWSDLPGTCACTSFTARRASSASCLEGVCRRLAYPSPFLHRCCRPIQEHRCAAGGQHACTNTLHSACAACFTSTASRQEQQDTFAQVAPPMAFSFFSGKFLHHRWEGIGRLGYWWCTSRAALSLKARYATPVIATSAMTVFRLQCLGSGCQPPCAAQKRLESLQREQWWN